MEWAKWDGRSGIGSSGNGLSGVGLSGAGLSGIGLSGKARGRPSENERYLQFVKGVRRVNSGTRVMALLRIDASERTTHMMRTHTCRWGGVGVGVGERGVVGVCARAGEGMGGGKGRSGRG